MNFSNPMFIIPAVTGPLIIIIGIIFLLYPPKKINGIYGYRTKSSKKSIELWHFAQSYSSKKIILAGILMLLFSLSGLFIDLRTSTAALLGLFFVIFPLSLMMKLTEDAIKKKFD